jgi:hypothetical protein
VTRQRLRPAWSPERLAEIYATPHDHRQWYDHELRIAATITVGQWMSPDGVALAADLSCGNGVVLNAIRADTKVFGDLAPGYDVTGPIEQTIRSLPVVDLLVCSETIEHLDDPDLLLRHARRHTKMLLLSTPVDAWNDQNPEHYWAWSRADVEAMLADAQFKPIVYLEADLTLARGDYKFGIWGCA